jgi:hypothetical protein
MSDWNFEDFLRRLEAIKGVESFEELVKRVPGLAQILQDVDFRLEELDPIERILRSMTREERLNPELLDGPEGPTRRKRVADDSGSTVEAVDSLIEQFQRLRTMLLDKSPEEVLRDTIKKHQPQFEDWQTPPDAWKGDETAELEVPDVEDVEAEPEKPQSLPFNEQVDLLLRKIAALGMPSLTDVERQFLDEASERYRNRREGG